MTNYKSNMKNCNKIIQQGCPDIKDIPNLRGDQMERYLMGNCSNPDYVIKEYNRCVSSDYIADIMDLERELNASDQYNILQGERVKALHTRHITYTKKISDRTYSMLYHSFGDDVERNVTEMASIVNHILAHSETHSNEIWNHLNTDETVGFGDIPIENLGITINLTEVNSHIFFNVLHHEPSTLSWAIGIMNYVMILYAGYENFMGSEGESSVPVISHTIPYIYKSANDYDTLDINERELHFTKRVYNPRQFNRCIESYTIK